MAPDTKLMGFEPLGSPSMFNSLKTGKIVNLDELETFVDGASMKNTGRCPWVNLYFILGNSHRSQTLIDFGR